jgi:hypothetical protein
MTTGPLTGKSVELVGRADPRAEAEYNMNLGATRADAVKHYLAQLGVTGFVLPPPRVVRSMHKAMTRPRGRWIDASICASPVASTAPPGVPVTARIRTDTRTPNRLNQRVSWRI